MAKQHFYSCVPARMSMYNKIDGYDTFAHSEGIEREFVENVLSSVYQNKPTKADLEILRVGVLPTVYCQFFADENTSVQSAVSFLKSDYTGERSAYMVHSLVLDENEKKAHFEDYDAACFNADVFKKDLSDFELTSPVSKPDTAYPEIKVPAEKAVSTKTLVEKYDTGMLKRLIYALIGISCGKVRGLYLSLPCEFKDFSDKCLEFLNAVFCIFPYHVRSMMSFVTYTGDVSKFNSFKIKCVPESTPAVPTSKGITLKMGSKEYTGISDDIIAANASVVDFFYLLMSNDGVRNEFVDFCKYATEQNPDLKKPSFKNLSDLVFLFRSLSKSFNQKSVIPNDDVMYNFITVYDKNRSAIEEKYRADAMRCLLRYPETHTAIPKNIFSRIQNMYPEEPDKSRQTIMSVVLELIHTDVMRDKLFGFIKQHYSLETDETKSVIMDSLCRVYYGGFLQDKIIEFFIENFSDADREVRGNIVDKLLLTVRTPAVSERVTDFVNRFYGEFSDGEKEKFYAVFYEMLPEGDSLSRALCDIVDANAEDERKALISEKLISAVDADEKARSHKLCDVICTKCGFTESVLAGKVFSDWSNRKIFEEFAACTAQKPISQKLDTIEEILSAVPDVSQANLERFYTLISNNFNNAKAGVFELIAAADRLDGIKEKYSNASEFIDKIKTELIVPAIDAVIPTVFDVRRYPEGVNEIVNLSNERKYISECKGFDCVRYYTSALKAAESDNGIAFVENVLKIEGKPVRAGAAVLIKKATSGLELSDETLFCIQFALEILANGAAKISTGMGEVRNSVAAKLRESGFGDAEKVNQKADEDSLLITVGSVNKLFNADIPDELKASLVCVNGELEKTVLNFINKYPKKAKKFIETNITEASLSSEAFAAVRRALNTKQSGGGLFKKLFGK